MTFSSDDLLNDFADLIVSHHGSACQFDNIASTQDANANSLVFVPAAEQIPASAAIVVTQQDVLEQAQQTPNCFVVCVANVRLAQAQIKQRYADYQAADLEWPSIHPSAVVHPSAKLGDDCRLGPNAVIGANCQLAKGVIVRANTSIEHSVSIGEYSIINANVNIGYATQIGKRVIVQAGAIIGSEGYGFAPDQDNRYHRIPHTGNVVLEDDVHVGANSCIDRGTYASTYIQRGVKIDNLVHIAHNVQVGEDSLLTAQTVIAGSAKLGARVIASGQTGILDHKTVPDDTVLVQRAGVSEDLPHGGMWAGSPAKPFREWVKAQGLGKKIAKLEAQLKALKQDAADSGS